VTPAHCNNLRDVAPHPTKMEELSPEMQKNEYQKNFDLLSKITGHEPRSMAHPCGRYNQTTLDVLKGMEIQLGFRDSLSVKEIRSPLEMPRENHTNILKQM